MPDLFPDGVPDEARLAELRPSQLLAEEEKRRDALLDAKQSGDRNKLRKAKTDFDRFRTWQRSHRTQPAAGVTVASPDPVNVTATPKES